MTGGAGFIGSHLCKKLLERGYSVLSLDNYFTGSEENITHLVDNPRFKAIRHDVIEPLSIGVGNSDILEILKLGVDEIYNLASPASPLHYQNYPIETIKTAVIGAINMLELARESGAKVLQASTSEVYGDPTVHPQPESYWGNVNPIGIRSCYDEGKRCAETLFMDYHREYGVKSKIVRIFNSYGPSMHPDDGRVVSNFVVQALKGEELIIYGDGEQTRSFLYVDDLVEGLIRVMEYGYDGIVSRHDGAVGGDDDAMGGHHFVGPVNLGNPYEISIKELAERVIELTNSTSTIVFKEGVEDDPQKRQPDITLAKERFGWEPTTGLEEGLLKTIDYFRSLSI